MRHIFLNIRVIDSNEYFTESMVNSINEVHHIFCLQNYVDLRQTEQHTLECLIEEIGTRIDSAHIENFQMHPKLKSK